MAAASSLAAIVSCREWMDPCSPRPDLPCRVIPAPRPCPPPSPPRACTAMPHCRRCKSHLQHRRRAPLPELRLSSSSLPHPCWKRPPMPRHHCAPLPRQVRLQPPQICSFPYPASLPAAAAVVFALRRLLCSALVRAGSTSAGAYGLPPSHRLKAQPPTSPARAAQACSHLH